MKPKPEEINTINHDTCIRCSRCVNICPKYHLDLRQGKIVTVDDPARGCMQCGHCMAVCPTESIVTKGFDYNDFDNLPDKLPELDDFELLLKSRRSVRRYQDKPVPEEIVERIIDAASTAPIGLPPSSIEILVISDKHVLKEMTSGILALFDKWVAGFTSPIFGPLMRMMMPKHQFHSMKNKVLPLIKGVIEGGKQGNDMLTYDAPSVVLFHSSMYEASYTDNALIAMTYAMIAAEGLGLGSCVIGLIPPAINRDESLRKTLGIPEKNEVCGCLVLGYPSVTYNRTIPRKFKSVRHI